MWDLAVIESLERSKWVATTASKTLLSSQHNIPRKALHKNTGESPKPHRTLTGPLCGIAELYAVFVDEWRRITSSSLGFHIRHPLFPYFQQGVWSKIVVLGRWYIVCIPYTRSRLRQHAESGGYSLSVSRSQQTTSEEHRRHTRTHTQGTRS